MKITIKPLSIETLQDFLFFFDNAVFTEHPDWSVCYCYSFHFVGSATEWDNKEKNRSAVIELIKSHHMCGYLAYQNEIPIGWCNANDKMNYERLKLDSFKWIWDNPQSKTCSIVCFLVDPLHRGRGIASMLLDHVCTDYRKLGYESIEAYPAKMVGSNEDQCQGPLSMYIKSGFQKIRESEEHILLRKELTEHPERE